jgi:Uma2 family endonuclease
MSLLDELEDPRTKVLPITTDQYDRMIADGILEEGEPYELLNGAIIRKDRSARGEDPMTVGDDHTYAVMMLNRLNRKLEKMGCHLRPQQPILLPPKDEPEPDGAIVRGREEDYLGRKPMKRDILCVIEVSDASLRRDRTTKLGIYASGGIERYYVVNLVDRVVEVYTQPRRGKGVYASTKKLGGDETVEFPTVAGKALAVKVREILPHA